MPWVKIDDHFDEHPKLAAIGPLGWGIWLAGLAYCNRNLTDGFIPWSKAHHLASFNVVEDDGRIWDLSRTSGMAGEDIDADWVIGLLVEGGLWDQVLNERGRIEGYRIHDYEDYQPSREDVLADREQNAERQRRHRESKRNATSNAVSNAQDNAVSNEPVTSPPYPIPYPYPVPEPTEDTSADVVDEVALEPVEFTAAERKVIASIQHVRGMASVPDADIGLHLREVLSARGSPVTDAALEIDALRFRDHWSDKRQTQPVNERWRGWRSAMTNWFSRTLETPEPTARLTQHRNGRAPKSAESPVPGESRTQYRDRQMLAMYGTTDEREIERIKAEREETRQVAAAHRQTATAD